MSTILVVDDKEMMRDSVGATLTRAGFEVVTADGGDKALQAIASRRPDAVVTDLKMPGMTGIELIEKIRAIDDDLPVVMMTAFATVDTAVKAVKAGAFDYVTKPFEGDELIIAVKRAIQHGAMLRENALLRARVETVQPSALGAGPGVASDAGPGTGLARIIGDSPAMRRVKEQIAHVAASHGNVLVIGESGCGKEVVARAIHELSPRRGSAYLAVNCAALSESLLESELFGHEKGAFTGAEKLRKGRFELADRGTLLLDEISEVPQQIQAKLLRVLQERAFERVGSSVTIGVDVRVVATSNRDLPRSVASGQFRQDLFFRLNVLPIHLPPLRDRAEDIPMLAEHFVAQACAREGREPIAIEPGAIELMQQYQWPGNVRELQNICERAVVLSGGKAGERAITRALLQPWLCPTMAMQTQAPRATPIHAANTVEIKPAAIAPAIDSAPGMITPSAITHGAMPASDGTIRPLEDMERDAIVTALKRFNGHRQKTARALGIGVRTLGLKLKKWKQEKLVAETL